MMMNLCILSLLIEDVVAIGGARAKSTDKLLGESTPKPEVPQVATLVVPVTEAPEVVPEVATLVVPDEPDVTEEVPEVATKVVVKAEEEISCGGHTADSCAACLDHDNAPDDHTAASYCNGDCVVDISDDGEISCVKHTGPHVDCGFHQAETCEKSTNKAVGQGRFCNGSCEINTETSKCVNKEDL